MWKYKTKATNQQRNKKAIKKTFVSNKIIGFLPQYLYWNVEINIDSSTTYCNTYAQETRANDVFIILTPMYITQLLTHKSNDIPKYIFNSLHLILLKKFGLPMFIFTE